MLSDITIKGAAHLELSLYEKFHQIRSLETSCMSVLGATGVCVIDVCIDTAKYPIAGIEQLAFSVINATGAACYEECTLGDAFWSLKNAVVGLYVATPMLLLISPLKLLGHLCTTLPNIEHASPSNREVEAEARLEWIVYPQRASTPIVA